MRRFIPTWQGSQLLKSGLGLWSLRVLHSMTSSRALQPPMGITAHTEGPRRPPPAGYIHKYVCIYIYIYMNVHTDKNSLRLIGRSVGGCGRGGAGAGVVPSCLMLSSYPRSHTLIHAWLLRPLRRQTYRCIASWDADVWLPGAEGTHLLMHGFSGLR